MLQPATTGTQKTAEQAFSTKPAVSGAPEWNGGSFRTFNEILTSRLKDTTSLSQSGAFVGSSSDAKETDEANADAPASSPAQSVQLPAHYNLLVAQLQVDQTPASPEQSPQDVAISSINGSDNFQTPATIQKQRSGTIADAPAVPSLPKAAAGSSATAQPIPAAQAQAEISAGSANNSLTATITQPEQPEPSTVRITSVGTAQLQHAVTSKISSAQAQDRALDAHAVSGKTDSDAEAFQMDLHSVPELAVRNDSHAASQDLQDTENVPAPDTKYSAPGQTPNPAQPDTTNTTGDESAAAKRVPAATSIQTKNPMPVEQPESAAATQALSAGSVAQNSATGTPAQAPGLQGQFSLPSPRSADPNNAPTASARSAQVSAPLEAARPIAPNQMTVRMEGGSGQVINVRFVNQGDQVQVAVRSNDPSTTTQLRQGLTSLSDDLSRIGWKADLSAVSTHATAALHDASRPDTDSQGNNKGSALDWEQETPKKKSPAPELWEELKNSQET